MACPFDIKLLNAIKKKTTYYPTHRSSESSAIVSYRIREKDLHNMTFYHISV